MEQRVPDVVVVGAGVIGTTIAWRLGQLGYRVRLIDAGTLGGEASSSAAGMLLATGESNHASASLELSIEGIRLYPAFIAEVVSESGMSVDYQVCGSIRIAFDETEYLAASRQAEFHSRLGVRVERTSRGFLYPDDGFVDPTELLSALRRSCDIRNVVIQEHLAVSDIESSAYGALVVAAGAWSGQIRVHHAGRLVPLPGTAPVKGHLIGFQLPPGILGPMLRRGHTYLLQRSSGLVVAGSTEEPNCFDRSVDQKACDDIRARAITLLPALSNQRVVRHWVGFRPYAIGGKGPHIGRVEGTNIWLAYGHHRNGVLLAPLTAERIVKGICEDESIDRVAKEMT